MAQRADERFHFGKIRCATCGHFAADHYDLDGPCVHVSAKEGACRCELFVMREQDIAERKGKT